jgi:hypothetical protein
MQRKTICTMLILIMMVGDASAQKNTKNTNAVPGYPRSDQEKKNDKEIDRAYQSTIKGVSVPEKKKPDPWGDVRPAPPAAANNKQ